MEKNILKWRFDAHTFRLIGRDLITDRVTALFELVKNAYDANAENVFLEFQNVGRGAINSKIIIKDDGLGMSFDDIQNKWMVVGTANKRTNTYSPEPYNRRYVGEKGIGRFAVDKLGARVIIRTKQKGAKEWLNVELNWENYEAITLQKTLTLFTDVENTYFYEEASDTDEHGTELIITKVRESWEENDIVRVKKELSKIVSPFHILNPPFNIFLYTNEYAKQNENQPLQNDPLDFYSKTVSINYNIDELNPDNSYQEILFFDDSKKEIIKKKTSIQTFGGISMDIYYFNPEAKMKFLNFYRKMRDDTRIDGITIYRDGIVTTPFAEMEEKREKKRDILGIDKRLRRSSFDKISSADIIGVLNITKKDNPNIIDATNRQDFIENDEYRELKKFIIEQIDVLEPWKLYERAEKKKNEQEFEDAQKINKKIKKELNDVNKDIDRLLTKKDISDEAKTSIINIKKTIENSITQVQNSENEIKKGVENIKEREKENLRQENIYLSLMSLQSYAAELAHAVNTKIGSIKDTAESLDMHYPNERSPNQFRDYIKTIIEETVSLHSVVDFMLSYAKAGVEDIQEFSIKASIERLFNKTYQASFQKRGIVTKLELEDCIIVGHEIFFQDVLQQLINNSIKALENNVDKMIYCRGYIEGNIYVILFSDNGCGISKGEETKIFKLYYTTTAESGGAGIGLWTVHKRMEAMKGTIEVLNNLANQAGTTFKLKIPFKKI